MQMMAGVFRQLYPAATVWLFDVNAVFNRVLDGPGSYPLTSEIQKVDRYCPGYEK